MKAMSFLSAVDLKWWAASDLGRETREGPDRG